MAMLALAAVGCAIGGGIGGTILGMSVASIGFAVGATVGSYIDRSTWLASESKVSGSRLGDLSVQASTYGRMLPVIYAGRVAGNVIWGSDKREVRETEESGGKGGSSSKVTTETYHYYVSLAVSLGEGPIAAVTRAWADSTLIWDAHQQGDDQGGVAVYLGTDTQTPDSVIESFEGAGNAPGYRNQAYVLFSDFYLNDYGGRIPNFTFEVVGKLTAGWGEDLAQGLAQGTDGDIYLVSSLQRTLTRMDSWDFKARAVIGRADPAAWLGTLKAQPWRVCCDLATGHLFVTSLCDAYVQRIDPVTNTVVATIAVGIYPHEIIADGVGGVWVSHPWLDRLSRIDIATNTVATVGVAGQPLAFCSDGEGLLWISCSRDLVRFDPVARQVVRRVALDKWFPSGLAWNAGDGKVWFACSGNDVVGVINPSSYEVSWRNSGTWPAYVACHPADPRHTVFVSTFYGNRLKLLRRGADNGLDEFMEYKTEVWPGPVLALPDGRCLVSNTNRPFFQEVQGPR